MAGLLTAAIAVPTIGCGGDDGDGATATVPVRRDRDAGAPDLPDAQVVAVPRRVSCETSATDVHDLVTASGAVSLDGVAVQSKRGAFGLAFVEPSPGCLDRVQLAVLGLEDGDDDLRLETMVDACNRIDAAALTTMEDTFVVASVDNRDGAADLWVQAWSTKDDSEAYQVSDSPARESSVTLASYDGESALVVWVARDSERDRQTLWVRALDERGKPVSDAVAVSDEARWSYSTLSLSRVGELMALAYHRLDKDAGDSEIALELLDPETGEPLDARQVLAEDAGPEPTAAVAGDAEGGGVLYARTGGVNARQLWFQRLGPDGQPAASVTGSIMGPPVAPQRLVNSPQRAIDGTLAKMPTGYVAGYRELRGSGSDIKLMFLDRVGRPLGSSVVAQSTPHSGYTSVAFSVEGRMAFAWSDVDADNRTHIHLAHVPCVGE